MDQTEITELATTLGPIIQQAIDVALGDVRVSLETLYANQEVLMGEVLRVQGDAGTEMAREAGEAWRAWVRHEAKRLGMTVLEAKE